MTTFCAADEVPVVTLPKLRLAGLIPKVKVAAIPVPLRLTEVGEVAALLTIEMLPGAGPTAGATKTTVTVVCWPAPTFNGSENPLTLNPGPVAVNLENVNVAVPVFLMINAFDKLAPTTTLANVIDVGFI